MADRYANGKIYKLVNDVDGLCYVGSTCAPLSKRLYNHKKKSKEHPERHLYKHINEIGWDAVHIVLIEEFSCKNKMELERRERYFIEQLKPQLNLRVPTRTENEWRQENRDIFLEKRKQYREANRDKIIEYRQKYKVPNHDAILEKGRKYYGGNREKILEKNKKPWTCDVCNCTITIHHKAGHLKSKKHITNSQPSV